MNETDAVLRVLGAVDALPPTIATRLPAEVRGASLGDLHGPLAPSFAAVVADQCAQLAAMRDTKRGNGIWYELLGVLAYCEDGETLAQAWSVNHKSYSPEETAEKLTRWRRQTTGPVTCATLESRKPGPCQTCPHRGKITTPVQLGRAATSSANSTTAAASMANIAAPPTPLEIEVRRLAALPSLEYELERNKAAKGLGIRVTALDELVTERRPEGDDQGAQGRPLSFPKIEPWPEPVNGAAMLHELRAVYGRYCALPPHAADTLALWTVHAHAIGAAPISPRLVLMSPQPRCGKTTTLCLVGLLTPRTLRNENATVAAIFRAVDKFNPTLLLDEFDSYGPENEELRGIVNSGHRSDGAVLRVVGDDHDPRQFRTFAATAIACIGNVTGTIEDRSIILRLRRRTPKEPIERLRGDRTPADLADARRRAARWTADHMEGLHAADPTVPAELHDRAADNWRPLLAIADAAAGHWPETARGAALALSAGVESEAQLKTTLLLSDIRKVLGASPEIASAELVSRLIGLDESPWAKWARGFPITAAQVARQLSGFEIHSRQIRVEALGKKTQVRGYTREDFTDAFERYLPAV